MLIAVMNPMKWTMTATQFQTIDWLMKMKMDLVRAKVTLTDDLVVVAKQTENQSQIVSAISTAGIFHHCFVSNDAMPCDFWLR